MVGRGTVRLKKYSARDPDGSMPQTQGKLLWFRQTPEGESFHWRIDLFHSQSQLLCFILWVIGMYSIFLIKTFSFWHKRVQTANLWLNRVTTSILLTWWSRNPQSWISRSRPLTLNMLCLWVQLQTYLRWWNLGHIFDYVLLQAPWFGLLSPIRRCWRWVKRLQIIQIGLSLGHDTFELPYTISNVRLPEEFKL